MSPPASLTLTVMRELFNVQERDRWQLKTRQVVEREKLIVRCESEVLRVHGKAAYQATGVYVSYLSLYLKLTSLQNCFEILIF